MELLAGLHHLIHQLTGECFEHGHFLHDVFVLRHAPRAVVHELARRSGFGIQHGQALADHLLVPQGAAKRRALAHVI